jgi:FdhE protein
MSPIDSALEKLRRDRPEWRPWLTVVEEVAREDPERWESAVPPDPNAGGAPLPLLTGTTATVVPKSVRRLFDRLVKAAGSAGTSKMSSLGSARYDDADILGLFCASVGHDEARVHSVAAARGVDGEALAAVTSLLPTPFLQACRRRWTGEIRESWIEGYCPVCGARPAFVEVRGIERTRLFRCGRCGSEWHSRPLWCLYCGMTDHNELVTLVPEQGGTNSIVEACRACGGYVKAFTRLQGCDPRSVILEDLASVDFDVAAVEQGYARPTDAGFRLQFGIAPAAAKGLFAWNG